MGACFSSPRPAAAPKPSQHRSATCSDSATRASSESTACAVPADPSPVVAPAAAAAAAAAVAAAAAGTAPIGGSQTPASAFSPDPAWLVDFSELRLVKRLGCSGALGAVHQAVWNETTVAVKVFDTRQYGQQRAQRLLEELHLNSDLLVAMRHPNTVTILGMCTTPPAVIYEFCGRGSLYDVVRRASEGADAAAELTWARRVRLALGAASGLAYLHARQPPIVHGDLKSPNILVSADWSAKLIDFGIWPNRNVGELAGLPAGKAAAMGAHPRWLAPEMLDDAAKPEASPAQDAWSMGVVLWELLTWRSPYGHMNNFVVAIYVLRGGELEVPPAAELPGADTPWFAGLEAYVDVMRRCLSREPSARPTLAAVAAELRALLPAAAAAREPCAPLGLSSWQVDYGELRKMRQIGNGAFGRVYLCKWRETLVAVKELNEAGLDVPDDPVMQQLHQEADMMLSMRHPHIVSIMGVCLKPPAIVSEFCAQGSLYDLLRKAANNPAITQQLTWARRLRMALGAAKGMLYLHSCQPPIIHRDLKSPNLLVDDAWHVKVADFNLSDRAAEGSSVIGAGKANNPLWLSPEQLDEDVKQASRPSDVFSFGTILWELLTLRKPYEGMNLFRVAAFVVDGGRPALPAVEELPGGSAAHPGIEAYIELLQRCWQGDPKARPTFADIVPQLRAFAEAAARAVRSGPSVQPPPPNAPSPSLPAMSEGSGTRTPSRGGDAGAANSLQASGSSAS